MTRVVEGGETPIFKQFFSGWRDEGEQVGLGKVFRQGALGKSLQCAEYQFCRKFKSRFVWPYLHFSHLQSALILHMDNPFISLYIAPVYKFRMFSTSDTFCGFKEARR